VQEVRIADAYDRTASIIEAQKPDQADGVGRRRFVARRIPFDFGHVGGNERHLAGRREIEERGPREERRVEPKRMVRDEVIGAGWAQEIATHGAATNAPRGDHGGPQRTASI